MLAMNTNHVALIFYKAGEFIYPRINQAGQGNDRIR